MNTTYELNNIRKDADFTSREIGKKSIVSEVFAAMVNGEEVGKCSAAVKHGVAAADKSSKYIKELGSRAENGDAIAIAELNTLRRFVIEAPLMEEMKALSIFGSYKNVGFDETIEREVYKRVGDMSRIQAANGDVVTPATIKETYPVPTFTVSGGYEVDYRRVALGDMSRENEGIAQVRVDIRNRAMAAIIEKIYKAIMEATGVKYTFEGAGLTKTGVDNVLAKVRKFGKPTVLGEYALLSQFTPWAGYVGNINSNTITGISEKAMNEIAQNGLLAMYNGNVLSEIHNPYDVTRLNAAGDNFATIMPAGLGFVVPAGGNSPIATWTRGGLTSMTGNDVKTGKVISRFDLCVGVDIAKGREYEIGLIHDTNLDDLAD